MVWQALRIVTTLDIDLWILTSVMQTLTCVLWSQLLPILASHKYFCPQAIPGDPEFNQVEKDKEVENS